MQPMAGLFSQNERHPAFSMVSLCRENTRLNMRDIPSVFPSQRNINIFALAPTGKNVILFSGTSLTA